MGRLSELSKGKREYLPAYWPANPQLGRPAPIPMKLQVLTDDDMQRAVLAAKVRLKELGLNIESQYNQDEVETEVSVQVLAICCRDNDQPEKVAFATDADDLRANTAPWERGEVVDAWRPWQERRNPLRQLSEKERAVIDEALKKKDAATLRACGADMLASFMTSSGSPPPT